MLLTGDMTLDFQIPLEPQGARRRAQLILCAAHIIATEGLRACDHARVAALTGMTRGLIYKYFPKREDILFAVVVASNEAQDRLISRDIVVRGIGGLAQGAVDNMTAETREWLDHYVDLPELGGGDRDLSIASIILARAVGVDNPLGAHLAEFDRLLDERWFQPLRQMGLGEAESRAAAACLLAMVNHLQLQILASKISPAESQQLFLKTAPAVIQSLL